MGDSGGKLYVQYGCGLEAPAGWVNFDVSPTLRAQKIPIFGALAPGPKFPKSIRFGDIRKSLPIGRASCDAVYCSHTLEHLSLEDFRLALRNTLAHLRPGGRFRFVLPDLKHFAKKYVESSDAEASMEFMRMTYLGQEKRPKGLMGFLRGAIGNADHRWMWDFSSMEKELATAGFVRIRRAFFNDCEDPAFKAVESKSRWVDQLGVECFRPG